MTPCTRPPGPDWLVEHWEAWGREYAQRLAREPSYCFQWKQWEKQRVNHRLLPLLHDMTAGHCAYCDWFPMDTGTDPTIDHFKPKARFPHEVYRWENLYLCSAARKRELARFRDLPLERRREWIPESPFRYLLWGEID